MKLILSFLISPFLTIPALIRSAAKCEFLPYLLFSLLIGLYAYLIPPTGDMYHYAMDFEYYKSLTFYEFAAIAYVRNNDYFLPFIQWCFGHLGFYHESTQFLMAFVSSLMFFDIFHHFQKKADQKWTTRLIIILLFIFWSFIKFRFLLFRFGTAAALFTYGCFLLYYRKKYFGYLCFIFATLCHFSMIICLVPYLLSKLFPFCFSKRTVLILFVFYIFGELDVVSALLKYLPFSDALMENVTLYTTDYYKTGIATEMSIFSRIYTYISYIPMYVLFVIYYKNYHKGKFQQLINYFIIIMILAHPIAGVAGRYESITTTLLLIYFLELVFESQEGFVLFFKYKKELIYLSVVVVAIATWTRRYELALSKEYLLLVSPVYTLQQSFDMNRAYKIVDDSGNTYQ